MISAYTDIQMSLNAINKGAFEYITKPIVAEEILLIVENALSKNLPGLSYSGLGNISPKIEQHFFGNTDYYRKINTQINLVAPTDYNIVLCGESGSGKKALAYEIHKRSQRKESPFITITKEDLLAAFTVNDSDSNSNNKFDFFEAANGGTVLLHNVTDLPPVIQDDLLKIIKEKKICKTKDAREVELDIRMLISSTDFLWHSMLSGSIKENLFYFLNDYSIELLPLRSRKDEIILFANYFLQQANDKLQKSVQGFSPEVEIIFKNYVWPGNLRELKNIITKAIILSNGDTVTVDSLPLSLRETGRSIVK